MGIDFEFLDWVRKTIKEHPPIRREEKISYEDFVKITKYPLAFIKILIEPMEEHKNPPPKFIIEIKCTSCGKIFTGRISKAKLLHLLNNTYRKKHPDEFLCPECRKHHDQLKTQEKNEKIESYKRWMVQENQRTELFIEKYLNPNSSSDIWTDVSDRYEFITWKIQGTDENEVALYIQRMPYKDFLKTPYWKAIREKKLRDAGFKCQLCGRSGVSLKVHHNTYKNHGYEHRFNVMEEDLIVLCDECHKKIHG